MGLFDSIAGNLLGSALGGQNNGAIGSILSQVMSGQHGDLGTMIGGMLNQVGGLPGLKQRADDAGMGHIVDSWTGTGPNVPVSPDQLSILLGNEAIQTMASRFGVSIADMTPLISKLLPQLIDRLTPQGQVDPEQHQGEPLNGAISGLLQGGGLMNILGGLLGGKS